MEIPITMRLPPAVAREAVKAAAELNTRADGPRPWTHADLLREALELGLPMVLARRGIGNHGGAA